MDFLPKINYTYAAIAVVVVLLLLYLYKRKAKKTTEKLVNKKKNKVPVLDDKTDDDDSDEEKVESLSKYLYKKLDKGFRDDAVDMEKFNKVSKDKVSVAVFTELTTLYNDLRERDGDFDDITEKDYRKIISAHVV